MASEASVVPGLTDQPITVSLQRVRPLLDQVVSADIDLPGFLSELDLPPDLTEGDGERAVSLADYYRIQNHLSILIGDETCHLSERQLLPGSTDFVLRHVSECTSLHQVMRVVAESYNLLHGGEYNRVESGATMVDYLIDDSNFPYTFERDTDISYFSMESTLIFLHCMLATVCPQQAAESVRLLHLKRPRHNDQCGHLSYWQVPVKFGQSCYRLRFDAGIVNSPMPRPSATKLSSRAVYETILQAVARLRPVEAASIRQEVVDHFRQGVFDQHAVAEGMRMSVATLRRRLTEEGTSFRDLREQILNELACDLLHQGHSVSEVAERLGFAEFRSFVRAFKSWNGMTPAAYLNRKSD